LGCAKIQGIFYPAQAARNPVADLDHASVEPPPAARPANLANTNGIMKVEVQTPDREVLSGLDRRRDR